MRNYKIASLSGYQGEGDRQSLRSGLGCHDAIGASWRKLAC
ncbi:hypothetical protein UF75_0074 [Desulfosporosinus sp. I2]|nr:hypothetical protein UF75_0074 [Desulfosporosinus sp. I2]